MNATPTIEEIHTTCAIAGGGPAGMMLGFLLARAGIDVMVLEKHADFLRDFRGSRVRGARAAPTAWEPARRRRARRRRC